MNTIKAYAEEFEVEWKEPVLLVYKDLFGYRVGERFFLPDHLFNSFSEMYFSMMYIDKKRIEQAVDNLEISEFECYTSTEDDLWVAFKISDRIETVLEHFKPAKRYCEFFISDGRWWYDCWNADGTSEDILLEGTPVKDTSPTTLRLVAYRGNNVIFETEATTLTNLWELREKFAEV